MRRKDSIEEVELRGLLEISFLSKCDEIENDWNPVKNEEKIRCKMRGNICFRCPLTKIQNKWMKDEMIEAINAFYKIEFVAFIIILSGNRWQDTSSQHQASINHKRMLWVFGVASFSEIELLQKIAPRRRRTWDWKVDRVTYHHTPSYKRIGKKGEGRAYLLWWRVTSIINIIIIIINSHSFERSLIAELSPAKCRSIVSCEELLSWICSGVAVKWRQWNWHRHS